MGLPLSDAQCYDLLNETKDMIFCFLCSVKDEPMTEPGHPPGPLYKKAYERYAHPMLLKYPDYGHWIMRSLIDARVDKPIMFPVHKDGVFFNQGTRDQVLKVMLLTGTGDQVFLAAKEIKLVPKDYPETDESLESLRLTIKIMNDVLGQ